MNTFLAHYLKTRGLTQSDLAEKLGVTQSLVSQWVTGQTKITPERAKQIEAVTAGEVKRHDLRPDIYDAPESSAA